MKTAPFLVVGLACLGCDPASMDKHVTIENNRTEALNIYINGYLRPPVVNGRTTLQLSETTSMGGSVGIVAKSAKDGTELWKKEYRGKEMDAILRGNDLYIVIPAK